MALDHTAGALGRACSAHTALAGLRRPRAPAARWVLHRPCAPPVKPRHPAAAGEAFVATGGDHPRRNPRPQAATIRSQWAKKTGRHRGPLTISAPGGPLPRTGRWPGLLPQTALEIDRRRGVGAAMSLMSLFIGRPRRSTTPKATFFSPASRGVAPRSRPPAGVRRGGCLGRSRGAARRLGGTRPRTGPLLGVELASGPAADERPPPAGGDTHPGTAQHSAVRQPVSNVADGWADGGQCPPTGAVPARRASARQGPADRSGPTAQPVGEAL